MLLNIYGFFRMEMNSGTIPGYFLQALPIACIAGIVFFAIRAAHLKRTKARANWGQEILRVVFACYLTGLISLVVLPANFWLRFYDGVFLGWWDGFGQVFQLGGVNLVPSIVKCLAGELSLGSWVKTMLVGNVAMFVPFGFFLPLVTRIRGKKKLLLAAVAVPVCLEAAQLCFGRSFDVDDLICNWVGMMIGAVIAGAVLKAKSAGMRKDG